jgi:UDP-GlcNAc:undecaprenyl-phosphate GlcNAc-1-phosphate transferase
MDSLNLGLALLIFIGALALSSLLVWLSIAFAHRFDFLDKPDGDRKFQEHAIPKLGGLVIKEALEMLLPAIAAAAIGYADDKRGLSPSVRLALQACVGAAIALSLKDTVNIFDSSILNAIVIVIWVMVLINGVNLLDNSDGLAGATVLICALASSAVAAISGQILISALGLALAGTAAGFLLHNWTPARVYMGDSGAYFFGTMLAVLTLQLKVTYDHPLWTLAIPLLLVSLPLVDTGFVVASRIRRGLHPFTAGRDHLSHLIQRSGISVSSSVFILEALPCVTGAAAIALTIANT